LPTEEIRKFTANDSPYLVDQRFENTRPLQDVNTITFPKKQVRYLPPIEEEDSEIAKEANHVHSLCNEYQSLSELIRVRILYNIKEEDGAHAPYRPNHVDNDTETQPHTDGNAGEAKSVIANKRSLENMSSIHTKSNTRIIAPYSFKLLQKSKSLSHIEINKNENGSVHAKKDSFALHINGCKPSRKETISNVVSETKSKMLKRFLSKLGPYCAFSGRCMECKAHAHLPPLKRPSELFQPTNVSKYNIYLQPPGTIQGKPARLVKEVNTALPLMPKITPTLATRNCRGASTRQQEMASPSFWSRSLHDVRIGRHDYDRKCLNADRIKHVSSLKNMLL